MTALYLLLHILAYILMWGSLLSQETSLRILCGSNF